MSSVARVEGLFKRYESVTALDGLSFALPPGAVGLVGANGAGKTTLFRILLGLSKPTAGSVQVYGHDVVASPIEARRLLGYMPEHDCLPTDQSASDVVSTLGELSGLSARDARQRASHVLDLVGLDEARFRPIGEFSTGMRQRAKLAQAIVAGPRLVLLDEPTAGLDPAGREEMLQLVARLATFGISVLMATHVLDDIERVCDYVVMVDRGRLVTEGHTAELLATAGAVQVDVGPRGPELVAALGGRGRPRILDGGLVEVAYDDGITTDTLVALIAAHGLPIFRLSSRRSSLDEVFIDRAGR